MNSFRFFALAMTLFSGIAMAEPATDSSIRELLNVTNGQKLLDSIRPQFDAVVANSARQALKGKPPTTAQQQAINKMKKRMSDVWQSSLSWDRMEQLYFRLYRESFTEEEVKGMLAFYRTPAGQAVVNKMPLLMQKTMTEVQTIVGSTAPKIQEIQTEFAMDMLAASR